MSESCLAIRYPFTYTQVHQISGNENVTRQFYNLKIQLLSSYLTYLLCCLVTENREKCKQRVLRLFHNDSYSNYNSLLLKAEWPTIEVNRLQKLATAVFKTLKFSNPGFMHIYLKKGLHFAKRKNDLVVNSAKTATFGKKTIDNGSLNLEFST